MAKRRKRMSGKMFSAVVTAIVVAVLALLQGMGFETVSVNPVTNGDVYLHIIDVGQGSSTLIQQGKSAILIDAGEADYGSSVSEYINSCGIDELEYVVASHPHSDHIGGLPYVLDSIGVGEVLMPDIDEENLPTTKVYERFLDAIMDNGITASYCEVGDCYTVGDITMQILGPVAQVDDLNNMSAVCKLSVGDTDVMVLGDAETKELKTVYAYGGDFESELLLMGHHGSRTSIYKAFLTAVNPREAIISCGKNNSYGHPHQETIDYLTQNGIDYYRTDYSGTVVYRIDAEGFERVDG